MTKLGDDSTNSTKSPVELLQKFLEDNNLYLQVTPPQFRIIEGGLLKIDNATVIVDFKKEASSITPKN